MVLYKLFLGSYITFFFFNYYFFNDTEVQTSVSLMVTMAMSAQSTFCLKPNNTEVLFFFLLCLKLIFSMFFLNYFACTQIKHVFFARVA